MLNVRIAFHGRTFRLFVSTLLLIAIFPLFAAEPTIEFEVIARTGETPIPGGSGTFTIFAMPPAIDDEGNVAFIAGASGQAGIYTAAGICCQKVADLNTPVPGGGGDTFWFTADDSYDIDGGRVAFMAEGSGSSTSGVWSNVGQSSPNTLVEVARIDGSEWIEGGEPWVDGNVVAMSGTRVIPDQHRTILHWNGSNLSRSYVDPGAGYVLGTAQASISADAAIFDRYDAQSGEMGVMSGGQFDVLAVKNVTPMPGLGTARFSRFYGYPSVDRSGQDALFMGYGSQKQGLFKRANSGALENVADNTTVMPDSGGDVYRIFSETQKALAKGQVVFLAYGQYSRIGLYTDVGGELSVLVDNKTNDEINGEVITSMALSSRSFAYTPDGYMAVFKVGYASGGSAIIRATISDGSVVDPDTFTVYKDFSDNSSSSVSISLSCTSGTVTNNPQSASEGSPAAFSIEGAAAGATCTAIENSVPSGYTADQSDCQNGDPLNGSCTIVNNLVASSDIFTVYKDFSDNNTASVSFSLNCSSGTVTNNPQSASETSPAIFNISSAAAGATCTAIENSVPSGYTADQSDCQNGDPLNSSCTIVNNKVVSSHHFTVHKDFSDNNSASVSVSLSCSSGTVTNNPRSASENSPAIFNISGAAAGATCTAIENSVPSGYTADQSDCQNGDPLNGSCIIVNQLGVSSDTFTVYKNFSDDNPASVSVTLNCSSGTVTNNPQLASEARAARFTIVGASPGATCTATENSVPAGYTKDEIRCQNGDPLNGVCTIINTLIPGSNASFTVYKDFSDNNSASVSVSLSCSSGTVTNNPQFASESSPAVFSITGADSSATCTSVENSVPSGYTANQTDCQNGDPLNDGCTIVNTLDAPVTSDFTVFKDFSDDNPASVDVSVTCSSGTVSPGTLPASETVPAVFTIEGADPGTSCTATEVNVPSGYTANQTDCQNGDPLNGSCTIVNTLDAPVSSDFTVFKDFSDDNPASVDVSVTCSSGTVSPGTLSASESTPAVFTIEGAEPGASCTAIEVVVPPGYTANESDCQNDDPINGFCTIVNTFDSPGVEDEIVHSGFEDGTNGDWSLAGSVSVDGILAIGQYSLRHMKGTSSELSVSTAGYEGVQVTMHVAGTSLKKNDRCSAEVSTNGGGSWIKVIELRKGNDSGTFFSGTVSPSAANDNSNLMMRFSATGKGKGGGYCYGDEVIIMGTPK